MPVDHDPTLGAFPVQLRTCSAELIARASLQELASYSFHHHSPHLHDCLPLDLMRYTRKAEGIIHGKRDPTGQYMLRTNRAKQNKN